ncbi:MAG: hypothetical protein ACI9OJ_004862, partial [Myxococcota bacterium]
KEFGFTIGAGDVAGHFNGLLDELAIWDKALNQAELTLVSEVPCVNGAICQAGPSGAKCTCQPGFYGPDCAGVCKCVNGVCEDGATGTGLCVCKPGFSGPNAQGKCMLN